MTVHLGDLVACPDCHAPASVGDVWDCDGSPEPVTFVVVDCVNGHHYAGIDPARLHSL